MKYFALYTLARLGLFAVAFGLVWLVASQWWRWSPAAALWTAVLALVISAIASLLLLGPLRDRLAGSVHVRVSRARARMDRARRSEDVD